MRPGGPVRVTPMPHGFDGLGLDVGLPCAVGLPWPWPLGEATARGGVEDTATTVAAGSSPDTPLAEAADIPGGPERPDGSGVVTGRTGAATDACARGMPLAAASRPASEPEFGEGVGAGRSEEPNNGGNVTPGTVATPDRPAAIKPR